MGSNGHCELGGRFMISADRLGGADGLPHCGTANLAQAPVPSAMRPGVPPGISRQERVTKRWSRAHY
jgi:hypothetical protein